VLQKECEELNKRFITFYTKKRPYIILKWAQTLDGFIAPDSTKLSTEEFEQKRHITGFIIQKLVHKWRSEEDAILVGTNTIFSDNPALNVRAWKGRNPVRICLDRNLRLDISFKIFDQNQPTLIFTELEKPSTENTTYFKVKFDEHLAKSILDILFQQHIQSIIIEGGKQTLETFISKSLWDEAQIFTSPKVLSEGIKSPSIYGSVFHQNTIDKNHLTVYKNENVIF
jgi:diaminohydroxyphosphoribosylaminopyrimidine deaminase / 5-amino-6-(5-phosphoribosylamino)uracil reductase